MLFGQDLGGGHDGALRVVGHGCPQCSGRDRGLARAHVPLQQPAHRPIMPEVDADLLQYPLLSAGHGERQALCERCEDGLLGAQGAGGRAAEALAHGQDAQLQQEELIEA